VHIRDIQESGIQSPAGISQARSCAAESDQRDEEEERGGGSRLMWWCCIPSLDSPPFRKSAVCRGPTKYMIDPAVVNRPHKGYHTSVYETVCSRNIGRGYGHCIIYLRAFLYGLRFLPVRPLIRRGLHSQVHNRPASLLLTAIRQRLPPVEDSQYIAKGGPQPF
jgi:hypothetical protein